MRGTPAISPLDELQPAERSVHIEASRVLWLRFLLVGAAGMRWAEYIELLPNDRDAFANLFRDSLAEQGNGVLQAAERTAARWGLWAASRSQSIWAPSSTLVQIWLRAQRGRGPTVPQSEFRNLRWLEQHLGMPFHTSEAAVVFQAQ
eukprot:4700019-Heterocapsa_arctica.AAC.1